jgi:hypothetical protein
MSARRFRGCLLAAVALSGCATKWEVQKAPAADVITFSDGGDYLVTRTNGEQMQLREVRMEKDSLIGVKKDEPTGPAVNARLAIAVSDIRSIAIRKPDGVATTFWVATAGVFAVFVTFITLWSEANGT